MLFKEIPGNKIVKERLIATVNKNRVSHAQIFSGRSGSAKLALALAYARYLNCDKKLKTDSCGKCSSCLKYNTLSHPDLHLVFPVLKTSGSKTVISDNFVGLWRDFILNNVYGSLNDWIDLLGKDNKIAERVEIYKDDAISIYKKLSLKNFEEGYRVILIWMPEQMNTAASNKVLKILEEPPKKTMFLLVSENPNRLLPTINSRLQKTDINDFSIQDLMLVFKDKINKEEIQRIRDITNADLGKMIQLIEGREGADIFNNFSSWMRLVYKVDILNITKWVDAISSLGRKYQKMFLSYSINMIRECLIFNFANKSLLKTQKTERVFISKFSLFIHEDNSVMIVEELEKSIKEINRNANAKILFFELSLQMVRLLKVKRKFAIN